MDKSVANMVLAPCPFCGSADVRLNQVSTGGGWGVLCRTCHAYQDTRSENQELAITVWNRRSQPSLEGEVGEMAQLLARRDGEEFDGEVHLSSFEGARLASLLHSLSAENAQLKHEVSSAGALRLRMEAHKETARAAEARPSEAAELLASALDETELREGRLRDASSPHWSVAARQFLDAQGGGNG